MAGRLLNSLSTVLILWPMISICLDPLRSFRVLGWRTKALMWSELSHLLAANTWHQFLSCWGTNHGAAEGLTLNAKDGGLIVYCLLHLLMYSAVFIWYKLIKPNFYSDVGKDSIKLSIWTDMNCGFMFLPNLAIVMTVQITINPIYTEHNTLIIQSNLWLLPPMCHVHIFIQIL
jgi:hypothetical protein